MKITVAIVLFIFSTLLNSAEAADWFTLESENFLIHHQLETRDIAERVAQLAQAVHHVLVKKLNWQPREKTHIVLADKSDQANGYATPMPFNRSVLYLSPPLTETSFSLSDYDDWLNILITHEYTHILHLDKAHGFVGELRHWFGRMPLIFPNALNTPWIMEGLATYYETDRLLGVGRGQSAYYEMLIHGEVAGGIKPLSQVNLPISTWPAARTRYLYGVYFFQFIAERYGADKIRIFIENYSDNLIPWKISSTFRQSIGKDVNTLWDEYVEWLKANYPAPIYAATDKRLSDHGYATQSLTGLPDENLYYLRDDLLMPPALMHLDMQGRQVKLHTLHAGAQLDAHPQSGILISQPEICNSADDALYHDLYHYNFTAKKLKRLTHCARLVQAAWHPNGQQFAAVRLNAGNSELVEMHIDDARIEVLWPGENHVDIARIDWSPDGKNLVAAVHRDGQWDLELFSVASQQWQKLTHTQTIETDPKFSVDGQSILFSSENSGSYQIHRLFLANLQELRLTNAAFGAFTPVETSHGDLYYLGYSPVGFDVYQTKMLSIPVSSNTTSPNNSTSTKTETTMLHYGDSLPYAAWSSLQPRWWWPHLAYSAETAELGVITAGNDALEKHFYAADLAYDFANDDPIGAISYTFKDAFLASLNSQNLVSFTDDDVERVRREDHAMLAVMLRHQAIEQGWLSFLAVANSREHDRYTAPGVSEKPEEIDNLSAIGLVYTSAEQRPRAISLGDGRVIRMTLENSDLGDSDYSGNIYTLDWREYLRLGESAHVLALRLTQGWGEAQPRPFELGEADDESLLDNLLFGRSAPLINQRHYVLRGYEIAEIGRRMRLASAEWRLPISHIERSLMAPPIGLLDISAAFFAEAGAAWNRGHEPDNYRTSAGLEIYADSIWFYGLPLRLKLGFARGFDAGGDDQIYFTLGGSF